MAMELDGKKAMRKQAPIPIVARLAPFVGFVGTVVGQSVVCEHVTRLGPITAFDLMMGGAAGLVTTLTLTVLVLLPCALWTQARTKQR